MQLEGDVVDANQVQGGERGTQGDCARGSAPPRRPRSSCCAPILYGDTKLERILKHQQCVECDFCWIPRKDTEVGPDSLRVQRTE